MGHRNEIPRRRFLSLLGSGALAAMLPLKSFAQTTKPNVLFIAVDDLRPQLGCYGHAETISPNIDRLASEGTVFSNAFCQVPVCGPSRVCVLTGQRTSATQWKTNDLKRPFTSLPDLFKANGYYTLSNGKIFHHMNDREQDWSEAPWRSEAIYHGPGDWAGYNAYNLWQDDESGNETNPRTHRGPYCESADVPDEAYQDGKVAAKTAADLKRLSKMNQPFFLACGFWRPHLPFNAPKKYWDLYERKEIGIASNRFRPKDLPAECKSSGEIDGYGRTGQLKETEDFNREARHAYQACVSYVDAQIGKVLRTLADLGLADNTIVVLWGDHGWHLGEHDFWGKHNTLYNAVHAPLIIRAPGRKAGNTATSLVEFVDIYPTLCELAGISIPFTGDGESLAKLLDEGSLKLKEAAFGTWSGCRWVKTERYLYTEWENDGKVTARMLFDHEVDPDENENVAEKPEYQDEVERHARLLRR